MNVARSLQSHLLLVALWQGLLQAPLPKPGYHQALAGAYIELVHVILLRMVLGCFVMALLELVEVGSVLTFEGAVNKRHLQ